MKFVRSSIGLAALTAGLLIGGGAQAADAAKGKHFFTEVYGCFQCHGTVGQGSTVTSSGKVLTRTQMPYEAFALFVRTTNRSMPPYSEAVLPNADLADIYAYLQSIPASPDYKTIPILNQ